MVDVNEATACKRGNSDAFHVTVYEQRVSDLALVASCLARVGT